ncbi:hypothetical protein [Notoacmeibacter sp. MSK16QG-6]|uniref:hypothetical protein n=1 Tax=Notoacmeibacter sp. MSK16QG-6 TaxID=2957982 RepID=UPI00209FE27E|nr:hypothetical protein [Notoacmeibacter sp. MSK16QG-6]MCP1201074.1 hypothetical protein [Notoacmeibacter sp. MSK16QG-6]
MADKRSIIRNVPDISEDAWKAWMIALAILFAILVVVAGISTICADKPDDQVKVAQTFAPFLLAMGAAVTFATIGWRGTINSRQADEAKRQNDAGDRKQLADLLLKGNELVEGEPSGFLLGIEFLTIVGLSSDNVLAGSALDSLARQYPKVFERDGHIGGDEIAIAFGEAERMNRINANRQMLRFPQNSTFSAFDNMPRGTYVGASVSFLNTPYLWPEMHAQGRDREIDFLSCRIFPPIDDDGLELMLDEVFYDCTFVIAGRVKTVDWRNGRDHALLDVDLSGTNFKHRDVLMGLSYNGCRFDDNDPPLVDGVPISEGSPEWVRIRGTPARA